MNESSRAVPPPDDDGFFFRRRATDELAELQEEARRLIEEAQNVQEQWITAHERMTRYRRDLEQNNPPAWKGAMDLLLRQEREAHELSKLALEREQVRGRRLEDEVLGIQDQERDRVARDLHDGVCQSLVAVTFLVEMHLRQLRDLGTASKPLQTGQKIRDMLAATSQEMRSLAHGLSGVETGVRGEKLGAALGGLAERLNASGGVRCVVVCPDDPPPLGQAKATHLYRIVQEAVGNALRHGKAERIEIRLARTKESWQLTVTDDGVGVPEGTAPGGGLGMRSMQYRAAVIGGALEVRRADVLGKRPGTVVRCAFP